MLSRPKRQRLQIVGAGLASLVLALAAAVGLASAHTGKPATISATVSGSSVTVQGTWTWSSQATATAQYKVGYAIDWGDVTNGGNAVGTFHIGDGTAATNVVMTNVSPSSGTSGSFGPTGHTYAAPGTYTICVLIYDVGPVLATSQPTSGQFSLVAGGVGHNPDNSVQENLTPGTQCTTVQVALATPTPTPTPTPTSTVAGASGTPAPTAFESFLGETAVPSVAPTLPPTSTGSGSGSSGGSGSIPLILLAFSMILGVVALRPIAQARR